VGKVNTAMRRAKLLILECASENKEKMSEGLLMWELMRILGYEKRTNLKMIGGSNHLIEGLENAEERYIHISAHGDFHQTRGTYLKTPRKGKVYSSDLSGMWASRKKSEIPRLVVLSACEAGHIDMVGAFSNAGCKYCLAPLHETFFEDAAVFLALFYKLLLGEKSSPWIAFRNTVIGLSQSLPKLSGAWSFYERGEKCLV
jgi:CHAT domain-containing protein